MWVFLSCPLATLSRSDLCSDLSDRFRSLTAAHAQVTGLSTFLNLAYLQYQSAVLGFAKDLKIAEERYDRTDEFWTVSGLCSTQGDAAQLFAVVDSVIEEMETSGPEDIEALVYHSHGHFLNVLGHLHGESPHLWPPIPSKPTWASKHAPHVDPSAASSTPLPSVATPSSSKGKGRAVARTPSPFADPDRPTTPLFLPSPDYFDSVETEEVSSAVIPPHSSAPGSGDDDSDNSEGSDDEFGGEYHARVETSEEEDEEDE
jgi:hypothetical protein